MFLVKLREMTQVGAILRSAFARYYTEVHIGGFSSFVYRCSYCYRVERTRSAAKGR